METVELVFKYTQNEYVKAERQYYIASKIITKASIVVAALFLPGSFLFLFLLSFSIFSMIVFGVGYLAVLAGAILYFYIPGYKFRQTAKYQEEYTLRFSKEGIHFKTQTIDSEIKWSIYTEVWENSDFYFLIQAPRIYTLIPKRVFLDSLAKQTFEEIVSAKYKSIRHI